MTIQDVGQVMDILTAFYPGFYSKKTESEKYTVAMLWASVFETQPTEIVVAALKWYISIDERGFPPVPGQIMARVRQLTQPEQLSESEAWALVRKAVENGYTRPKTEFDKLPPLVQRAVGSPNVLRDWAVMNLDQFNTVVASNFQRAYRAAATKELEYGAMPPDVKALASKLAERFSFGRDNAGSLPSGGQRSLPGRGE